MSERDPDYERELAEATVRKTEHDAAWCSGVIHGLGMYAWWKDGVQFVGTTGTTLREAVRRFRAEQAAERGSRQGPSVRLQIVVDMSQAIRGVLEQYSVGGTHMHDLPDEALDAVTPIVGAYFHDLDAERERRSKS